jgi:hypothetical protein
MTENKFTSLSKQFMPAGILVMTVVLGIIFVLNAAETDSMGYRI